MYVIAGLGNPGLSYRKTRHNAGFQALEALADKEKIRLNKKGFSGVYGEGKIAGERVVLVKPTTYMNLSGNCIQQVLHFYKVPVEKLIVFYDDIELPVGGLRIRGNGSAGTHNGMRSIIACVNSEAFPRIRVGVGRQAADVMLADYVLKKPSKEEQKVLEESFESAAEAAVLIVEGRLEEAQARYNKKK